MGRRSAACCALCMVRAFRGQGKRCPYKTGFLRGHGDQPLRFHHIRSGDEIVKSPFLAVQCRKQEPHTDE